MLENRLRGAKYPICCEAEEDHVCCSEQMMIWKSNLFVWAHSLKSECESHHLVSLFSFSWRADSFISSVLSNCQRLTGVKFSIGRAGLSVTMGTVVIWLSGNGKYSHKNSQFCKINVDYIALMMYIKQGTAKVADKRWAHSLPQFKCVHMSIAPWCFNCENFCVLFCCFFGLIAFRRHKVNTLNQRKQTCA